MFRRNGGSCFPLRPFGGGEDSSPPAPADRAAACFAGKIVCGGAPRCVRVGCGGGVVRGGVRARRGAGPRSAWVGVGAVVRRRSRSAGMKKGRMEKVAFGPAGIIPRDAGVRERGGRARWGVGGELRPRSGWDSVGTRGAASGRLLDLSDAGQCAHSFPAVGLVSGRYNQFADGTSYAPGMRKRHRSRVTRTERTRPPWVSRTR